jgi:predicted enzyme related to lactoylglutathione lyase
MVSGLLPYGVKDRSYERILTARFIVNVNSFFLNINSEQPARLGAFYRDVVGLPVQEGMGDWAFVIGPGTTLGIDGHSEVHGRAKDPARILIDLWVDDVAAEQKRLEGQAISFLRSSGKEYWGGIISTFEDPDGNYIQLMQMDPVATQQEPAPATA